LEATLLLLDDDDCSSSFRSCQVNDDAAISQQLTVIILRVRVISIDSDEAGLATAPATAPSAKCQRTPQ